MSQTYGGEVDLSVIEGVTKDVFGKLIDVIPDTFKLQEKIRFNNAAKIGEKYTMPVALTRSHGFTYNTGDAGAFALNAAVAATHKEASVTASEIVGREYISYKAASSAKGGAESFVPVATHYVGELLRSTRYRVEASCLYGGTSIATLSSDITGSGTTRVFQINDASFAPGILQGLENASLDAYDDEDGTTQQNANAALTVDFVDFANKRITLTGNATDMGTIATTLGSATVELFFRGSEGKEMTGLDRIARSTGTLFGISGASYNLWAGNSHALSSTQLDFASLQAALVKPGNKGAWGESFKGCISHPTFADLNADAAALRAVDSGYSESIKQGHNKISYVTSVGELEVWVHPMLKQGEALLFPLECFSRIGSTDVTSGVPGSTDRFLAELPDNAGYQIRMYSDQALFCDAPAKCVKITGIVNSS